MTTRSCLCLLLAFNACVLAEETINTPAELRRMFADPPIDCWPRTRWWWMGNAMTNDDITWQLHQMKDHGIGGVEQITMEEVYERGNNQYLSPEFLDQVKHTVDVAQSLGMSVSFNFGGPGWIFGGDWVPPEDQNQCLISSALELDGPRDFTGSLSMDATINPLDVPRSVRTIGMADQLVAVVAGKVTDGKLAETSLTDITHCVTGHELHWRVPDGHWRVMAFWLTKVGDGVVDHFNKRAMESYFDHVGSAFDQSVGKAFGKTVESFFSDSFEVPIHRNGVYWNSTLLSRFREMMGYDLTVYLPAIWWQIDAISPKVRYDVNAFLDRVGFEAFYTPFLSWCERHGVKGRIQPYGFPTDNLEGAGRAHIPEMEITAGEKDAVPWFDTRIFPRTYVASGAHLYGRNIVSVEAYTYLHWELYRETLEELKIASDMFLLSGANLFYNSGYVGTPERDIAPTRDFTAAIHVDHRNIWWPHYPMLARYIARSCFLLRHGHNVADVAVYSPLANQWTQNCLNARRWTRDFQWGDVGKLIWANGYNFDLINDDALQNRAVFDGQEIRIGENAYRLLILPNVAALPLKSFERVEEYVAQGGVAIALERTPDSATGFKDHAAQDLRVRDIASKLFTPQTRDRVAGERTYGKGRTYQIHNVIDRTEPLDRHSSVLDPFVNTIRRHVTPDFGIDFVGQDLRENNGLVFNHRTSPERDIYFVANVQDQPIDMPITFRIRDRAPFEWNPVDGQIKPIYVYETNNGAITLPLRLGPFASTFIVFESGHELSHATHATFDVVSEITQNSIEAWTQRSGIHQIRLAGAPVTRAVEVDDVPAPMAIDGEWTLVLESPSFPRIAKKMERLDSWTEHPDTRHFSGVGQYTIHFHLPSNYADRDIRLVLDLGSVGNVAEVEINNTPVGTSWYRSQRLDVTKAVHVGENSLVVRVTNTLINRITGLERMPSVPDELARRLGDGVHDADPTTLSLLRFGPLPRSGLLGPVRLLPQKRVTIPVP